jgi:hypothetical protein
MISGFSWRALQAPILLVSSWRRVQNLDARSIKRTDQSWAATHNFHKNNGGHA